MNNLINAYQPKVKNKNWYLPEKDRCSELYNANHSDGKVAAAIAKAGGTYPGQIWTSEGNRDSWHGWANPSTGENGSINEATFNVRAFLNY